MVKTIKVIHLAPGNPVLITAAPALRHLVQAAASCPYACGEPKQFCDTHAEHTPKEIVELFPRCMMEGWWPMYVITITNIDHNLLEVRECRWTFYKVCEDSRRQEERQRYERRKHIDGRSFDNRLLFELATEPLEQTYERIERLREIQAVLVRYSTHSNVSDLFCILPTVTLTRKLPKCRVS